MNKELNKIAYKAWKVLLSVKSAKQLETALNFYDQAIKYVSKSSNYSIAEKMEFLHKLRTG
jgi:hypothetical protein